jgi:uncharacterized membrane protein YvlD (DUF360 family)
LNWLVRLLVTWLIEALALAALTLLLPGVRARDFGVLLVVVLYTGLANALIRPVVLRLALNLGFVPFVLVSFFVNALSILVVDTLLVDFEVDNFGWALVVAVGMALLNGVISGLLSLDDDDSYYRNVIRRAARRASLGEADNQPGTVILQIDGLAEPILRRLIAAGRMPALASWLATGSHTLVAWECDIPSMTTSSQAGILHGNNANIPAFRWYDKELGRLLVSNHPKDARLLDGRQSVGRGLLRREGSSISNIFSGGADHLVLTQAALYGADGSLQVDPRAFYSFFVNPYNLYRSLAGTVWEVAVEYRDAWRQRRAKAQPCVHRGGWFPLLRAVSNVLLRDLTVAAVVDDLYAGRLVSYSDFLGYDEIAHHAGPDSREALNALRQFDARIRRIALAAREAPRPYQIVVLSDHGQSLGATFRQRYGYTLAQLIHGLLRGDASVSLSAGEGEGWGHLNAMLTQSVQSEGITGRGAQRLLERKSEEGMVDLGPEKRAERDRLAEAQVVVCASGNLAQVYMTGEPGRLSLEYLVASYPGLVEGLLEHPGIGFIVVDSEVDGPVAIGAPGVHRLQDGTVAGTADPLASYGSHTARFLLRMATYPNTGDITIVSHVDPASGEVAAFEELIGSHGGAGGLQTRPFLLYPSEWTETPPDLVGAEEVHAFLAGNIGLETAEQDGAAIPL